MTAVFDNATVESLATIDHVAMPPASQATAAGTLTLTAASATIQFFTGTTAGQIVKLPDATTLTQGRIFEIWNLSTQVVSVQNNAGTALFTISVGNRAILVAQTVTTAAGVWVWYIVGTGAGSGGPGVSPPFLFGRSGALGLSSYLYSGGQVPSNQTGLLIPGLNYITKLTVSCSQADNYVRTFQIQRRTAVSTFVDIAGASVSMAAGAYSASVTLATPIAIGADYELAAYLSAGSSGTQNPILYVFVVPQ